MSWDEIKENLRLAYDREAANRERHGKEGWKRQEREAFLRRLEASGAQRLLDLGTGTGDDACFFQEAGFSVAGVDLSPEMVRIATGKGLEVHELDMTTIDSHFPAASFDCAWSMNAFLHIPKARWGDVLSGVQTVLAPGGLFFLGVYGGIDRDAIWEEDHYRPQRHFTFHADTELRDRLERAFEVLDLHFVDYGHPLLHFQAATLRRPRQA